MKDRKIGASNYICSEKCLKFIHEKKFRFTDEPLNSTTSSCFEKMISYAGRKKFIKLGYYLIKGRFQDGKAAVWTLGHADGLSWLKFKKNTEPFEDTYYSIKN